VPASSSSASATSVSQLFNRHKPTTEIARALAVLLEYKLVKVDQDRSGDGRPTER
jgi:hypothetical protein